MYRKISDYGIIGNLHSIALVGLNGSIDWMCMPHMDSPSVFGALLDDRKGGFFSITPVEEWDSTARYVPDTNVLLTMFRTRGGTARITDFMPVGPEEEGAAQRHDLYRLVEVERGEVSLKVVFEPRFDYARARTALEKTKWGIRATGEATGGRAETVTLCPTREMELRLERAEAVWRLAQGEQAWLHLKYGDHGEAPIDVEQAGKALRETEAYWRGWLEKSETGRSVELGAYREMVNRSALVLKLLFFGPTGAIAAAATTSLPECVGGVRNWDYRYTWLRDTSFTLQALFNLGHLSETEGYLRWIRGLLSRYGLRDMQIMYGLRGEADLAEEELAHLDGYKGSRPVRAGNAASGQRQLDIYGELMDAALKLSDYVGKIDIDLWPFLRDVCDYVAAHWREKDNGIWEVRGRPRHFVYSKVMCWLALDRGVNIARRYGFPADIGGWRRAGAEIREEVLQKGWSHRKNAFVQHYETDALDSTGLLMAILGFLPFDDPRVVSTVEAIRRELAHDGFLYRYKTEDGLPGEEGAFLLCSFWLVDNLVAVGKLEEAEALLRRMEGASNHLGLFSEQYDARWREALGNFPQAFTHIGYINSVLALMRARTRLASRERMKARGRLRLPAGSIVLNDSEPGGEPGEEFSPGELVPRLKRAMNTLRGAFFDTARGRVAYELMAGSRPYEEYLRLSYALKRMDPGLLEGRRERTAFWVNLYNVIVIHGVIALGIRDSVKEVSNFFRRVKYRIGDMHFSPDDIEHGILRGNRRPPYSILRRFGRRDARLRLSVREMDPRIHFALVCASSSCPPIDLYTAGSLDREIAVAAGTFLNSGGIVIDRETTSVSLSRIFKWYGKDFGGSRAEVLRAVAGYLYGEEDRAFLLKHAEDLKVSYQDYDWRLNRT
jgi:GH15 family glucan-1,4-alpha-glucosidase